MEIDRHDSLYERDLIGLHAPAIRFASNQLMSMFFGAVIVAMLPFVHIGCHCLHLEFKNFLDGTFWIVERFDMSDAHAKPNNIAKAVVDAFGGLSPLGRALGGVSPSTIHAWVQSGHIPYWRIDAIINAARRAKVLLPETFGKDRVE